MNYLDLKLKKKYPEFLYDSFNYSIGEKDFVARFEFRTSSEIVFRPEITIKDIPSDSLLTIDKSILDNFVFHLGLAEIPTYWKATCSPKIIIKCGYLDEKQLDWWKDLLISGMGQFFFENRIDFTAGDFLAIVSASDKTMITSPPRHSNNTLRLYKDFRQPRSISSV